MYLFFFAEASLLFVHFLNVFCSCSVLFCKLKNFSRSINTHTGDYGRPTAAIYRLHIMFYTKEAHANERFISCNGHQLYAFKGLGYNYRDASRAGRTCARPASFKGRRYRTRRRSQCVLVKIWRSTWNTYLVWRLNVIVR